MRICAAFLVIFGGLAQLASAATISAIMRPNLGSTPSPGQAFKGGSSQGFFGTYDPANVPDDNKVYTFLNGTGVNSFTYTGGKKAVVETTVRRNNLSFFSTTYAYYEGLSASEGETYKVVNGGYWQFTVVGNFDFAINAAVPVISGNTRTYKFEKLGEGGSVLASDLVGTTATSPTGSIGTGTYRLYFDHSNSTPGVNGPSEPPPANLNGGTNLDIVFTQSSGGAVPEPSSVAVFGLLSIGGALAKWRRKK
jgi:hypothetical protein